MRRSLVCLLALIAAPAITPAQIRYHFGDDPRWATPSFDDAGWKTSASDAVPAADTPEGILWVRTHVRVPSDYTEPGAVMWPECGSPVYGPAELFVNGVRVAAIGRMPPDADAPVIAIDCVFPVPAGLISPGRDAFISVRAWTLLSANRRLSVTGGLTFGRLDTLRERASSLIAQRRLASMGDMGLALLVLMLGVSVWVFWKVAARQRILFWSAAWLFVAGFGTLNFVLTSDGWLPWWEKSSSLYGPLLWGLTLVILAELTWAANELPRGRILFGIEFVLAVPTATFAVAIQTGSRAWLSTSLVLVLISALTTLALGAWCLRRPGDARTVGLGIVAFALWGVVVTAMNVPTDVHLGVLDFQMTNLSMTALCLGVTAMLVRRAWSETRRVERLNAEIAAAREIQSSLMPAQCPQLPGFSVEAVYVPANEVGGDFYQVLPCPDGSSLIAVGDVSGKGLKAAMIASLVTGVIQSSLRHTSDPARILHDLNAVLSTQMKDGFVTCCCLCLERGGAYTVANAGHLPPYIGSSALTVEAGLPLGIVPDACWENTRGSIRAGDTIVLISDGVVEARRPSGELYGFERVQADLSVSSDPTDLARKAQRFGQEDDITVLSISLREAGAHVA